MTTPRWCATALTTALLAGPWAGPAAGAAQRWAPLTMSYGGHTWTADLKQPLFRNVTMVPGQTETRSFYVRNGGDGRAQLSVKVVLDDPTGLAATRSFWLSVGHQGDWTRVKATGEQAARFTIQQGGVERLQVRAQYLPSATNANQLRSLNFMLKLRLTQSGR